jgi:hypothetical protein
VSVFNPKKKSINFEEISHAMDLSAQIKNNLISRIKDSSDLNFLKALQTIFDTSEQSLYKLSKEQESSIKTGRDQIANGQFIKNDQVISEMRSWLKKK